MLDLEDFDSGKIDRAISVIENWLLMEATGWILLDYQTIYHYDIPWMVVSMYKENDLVFLDKAQYNGLTMNHFHIFNWLLRLQIIFFNILFFSGIVLVHVL